MHKHTLRLLNWVYSSIIKRFNVAGMCNMCSMQLLGYACVQHHFMCRCIRIIYRLCYSSLSAYAMFCARVWKLSRDMQYSGCLIFVAGDVLSAHIIKCQILRNETAWINKMSCTKFYSNSFCIKKGKECNNEYVVSNISLELVIFFFFISKLVFDAVLWTDLKFSRTLEY